tara:strand:- start:361 stop:894 length:534 start_codon:yes stop_codon:yes gene_type:complete
MVFRNPENADKALDSTDKGSRSLLIIFLVIGFVLFIVILSATLYAWTEPGHYGTVKNAPTSSMIASVDGSNWTVQVVKINPLVSINSVHWYLLDLQGNTKTDGLVSDVYGYEQGEGKAVRFIDEDFNGKLSPGDKFKFHPSEPNSDLEDINVLSGFSFRLKFEPTGDVLLGNDLLFE